MRFTDPSSSTDRRRRRSTLGGPCRRCGDHGVRVRRARSTCPLGGDLFEPGVGLGGIVGSFEDGDVFHDAVLTGGVEVLSAGREGDRPAGVHVGAAAAARSGGTDHRASRAAVGQDGHEGRRRGGRHAVRQLVLRSAGRGREGAGCRERRWARRSGGHREQARGRRTQPPATERSPSLIRGSTGSVPPCGCQQVLPPKRVPRHTARRRHRSGPARREHRDVRPTAVVTVARHPLRRDVGPVRCSLAACPRTSTAARPQPVGSSPGGTSAREYQRTRTGHHRSSSSVRTATVR